MHTILKVNGNTTEMQRICVISVSCYRHSLSFGLSADCVTYGWGVRSLPHLRVQTCAMPNTYCNTYW